MLSGIGAWIPEGRYPLRHSPRLAAGWLTWGRTLLPGRNDQQVIGPPGQAVSPLFERRIARVRFFSVWMIGARRSCSLPGAFPLILHEILLPAVRRHNSGRAPVQAAVNW